MVLPGARLGNYRVGSELGRGGMGIVYRAVTEADGPTLRAGSVVAVKIFDPELMADERTFARDEERSVPRPHHRQEANGGKPETKTQHTRF